MDIILRPLKDAKRNAKRWALLIHSTKLERQRVFLVGTTEGYRADALIVTLRTGLDDKLLETLSVMHLKKMVYVSCNVSTLAQDLVKLASQVYDVHPSSRLICFRILLGPRQ